MIPLGNKPCDRPDCYWCAQDDIVRLACPRRKKIAETGETVSYKISYDACEEFRNEVDTDGWLTMLDVRLGLEQVQDTPEFRNIAEIQWENSEAAVDAFPDFLADRFRAVSDRHAKFSLGQFRRGFAKVLNHRDFVASCRARWAFQDEHGKPHVPHGIEVDLDAMPDPDTLRA